jgi:hypothetical protein
VRENTPEKPSSLTGKLNAIHDRFYGEALVRGCRMEGTREAAFLNILTLIRI